MTPDEPSTGVKSGDLERSTRPGAAARVTAATVGLALVGSGVAAVFATKNGTGAAAMITLGAVTLVIALLGDQLQSLRYGDLEVVLRQRADDARGRGDVDGARALTEAADTVSQSASRTARSYKAVRSSLPPGSQRTAQLDEIVADAAREASRREVRSEEVLPLLWTGDPGERAWALGVLQAKPDLATVRAVLECIERPDSKFDQYHALLVALKFVRREEPTWFARERVGAAVKHEIASGTIDVDGARGRVAEQILRHIEARREER